MRIRGYDSLRLNLITAGGGHCIPGFSILVPIHPLDGKCKKREAVKVGMDIKDVCVGGWGVYESVYRDSFLTSVHMYIKADYSV